MGCHLVAYLYCDGNFKGCECQVYNNSEPDGFCEASAGDSQFETIAAYKKYARSMGWVFRGQKAFCSNCKHGEKE
ncbi:hypothetical protein LCGC14_2629070 [marine sediment metagenome]|uniref:Uncharacterized protein n=1 Tax=marine sediment metagenome TaxID=412755 RepID=A0A0F9CTB4_9ZZZZ